MLKPAKRLKVGTRIQFNDNFACEVVEQFDMGEAVVKFDCEKGTFEKNLLEVGTMPLPPYIHEKLKDKEAVQLHQLQDFILQMNFCKK